MQKHFELTWNPPTHNLEGCEYTWQSEYASINHNGGFSSDDRRPARPWVFKTVFGRFNIVDNFKSNISNFNFDSALRDTAIDLKDAFTETISSPIFYYDTTTYRQNGTVVTSPRDVVDMGDLRDSLVTRVY
jgi:hypothetical protein